MANIELWKSDWEKPFRALTHMQTELEDMMRDLWGRPRKGELTKYAFTPSCEVSEEKDKYLFRFDLPGVNKEDVKMEISGHQLTVSAERKEEKKKEDRKTHVSEIYYGSYTRSFALPDMVDETKIDAKFENGVLNVTVPKTEATKSKQISIH